MKQSVKSFITRIFVRQMQQIIKKHKPIIVAVVGSVGKTSTKLAIAKVLSEKYRVLVQQGNYNTPIAVPFIFLDRPLPTLHNPFSWFKAYLKGQKVLKGQFPYDVVVIELGSDQPGDLAEFKPILQPDIGVVTAISPEHMEFFGAVDAVAAEEFTIASYVKKLVINLDDIDSKYVAKYTARINIPVKSYGFSGAADCKISSQTGKVTFAVGDKTIQSNTSLIAKHSLSATGAAALVASELGLSPTQIAAGVAKVRPFAGRMQLLKGIKNSTIIDDSYNASPLAVKAALETLLSINAPQRIALLGNMNELGDTSKQAHEQIGKMCDPKKLDLVVTLGPDANKYIAAVAEKNGCQVLRADSPYKAGRVIEQHLKDGAYVLIKGSQNGVFSEEAIKPLLADPADVSKLVRQTKFWLTKKHQAFADFI